MPDLKRLRVATLIDLPRSDRSGGHIRGWEFMVRATEKTGLPIDITMFTSGTPPHQEEAGLYAHFRQMAPVFSTARLKFLPYVPDHTDLAPYHPALARALADFDVIHTTDGYFNFCKTAERVARRHGIALTTSLHTDTPSYARVFTRKTLHDLLGDGLCARFLDDGLHLPERQEKKMTARLAHHLSQCRYAFAARAEDRAFAENIVGKDRVFSLRHGIDRTLFGPHRADRASIEKDYDIPAGRIVVLFVGRLDEGKNIYTLIAALEKLIAQGLPLHLVTAGIGPAEAALKERLKGHVSVPGFVQPSDLGRLYASADILALVSEVEMRSLAGGEAVVSGLPTLVAAKSGVYELFHATLAMQRVEGGAEPWAESLRILAETPALRDKMRAAALAYADKHLPDWTSIMAEDFIPVWQRAYDEKGKR